MGEPEKAREKRSYTGEWVSKKVKPNWGLTLHKSFNFIQSRFQGSGEI